jgi:hypothetical protein
MIRAAWAFYFAVGEGEGLAGVLLAATDAAGEGLATGEVAGEAPGAAAPGATVAAGSGGFTLKSSTSKINVELGPMSRPAPRSP